MTGNLIIRFQSFYSILVENYGIKKLIRHIKGKVKSFMVWLLPEYFLTKLLSALEVLETIPSSRIIYSQII